MRDIKFRGKRIYDGEWVYGSLIIDENGNPHIWESKDVIEDGHHIKNNSDKPMFFDETTIGQYTEYIDNNGIEVYEGDTVRYKSGRLNNIGIVKYGTYVNYSGDYLMYGYEDGSDALGFYIQRTEYLKIRNETDRDYRKQMDNKYEKITSFANAYDIEVINKKKYMIKFDNLVTDDIIIAEYYGTAEEIDKYAYEYSMSHGLSEGNYDIYCKEEEVKNV